MDHRFRGERRGLIVLGTVSERRSREECKVIVDPYAAEAIRKYVPLTLRNELEGWARSVYTLEQHVKAIEAYDIPKLHAPSDVAWLQTTQYVEAMFRRFPKVSPISYERFDDVKWMRSSAAGYGYTGHKGDTDNYSRAKRTAVTIAEKLDHDRAYGPQAIEDSTPDVAFTRTQLSQLKVKSKVRNVWGEAFHYVLLEGIFADPLIELFKEIESFYFIGRNPLLSVPALIEEILSEQDYIYMFDWSAFDASVQEWEIRFAFQCLGYMLTFPSNVEAQIWSFLIELFIYRKIAGPNQVLYLKTQGIPSGSCFTNIIGSITNFVRIQYMFKRLTDRFAVVYTHGDDSLAGISTTQYVPMHMFEDIANPLNWRINVLKSSVSRESANVTFLSRQVRERQNYREELACLRMLIYPEYQVENGAISTLRARSIFVDAGLNSQYLYEIFKFLKNKYGTADFLPFEFRKWDPVEYEARRTSASELM